MIGQNPRHSPQPNACLFLEELFNEIEMPVKNRKTKDSPRVYRFNPGKARQRRIGTEQEGARGRSTHNFKRNQKTAKTNLCNSPVPSKQIDIKDNDIDDSLGTIAALFSDSGDDSRASHNLNTSHSNGLNNSISNISHVDDNDSAEMHEDYMFCSTAYGKIVDQDAHCPPSNESGSTATKTDSSHQDFSNSWSCKLSPSSDDVKMSSSDSISHPKCCTSATKSNISCLGKRDCANNSADQSMRGSTTPVDGYPPGLSNKTSLKPPSNKREAKAEVKSAAF